MGYHIVYLPAQKNNTYKRYIRLPVLTMLSFFLFVFLVTAFWPDGATLLRKALFGTDGSVAVSALEDFADGLQCGRGLAATILDFCREMIS